MKLNFKNYKIIKTKNYIKKNNFFFIFNTINQNSNNRIKNEQNLMILNCSYYKIFNKTSNIVFENSIYKNSNSLINNIVVFLKVKINDVIFNKNSIINLEPYIFLALKLNNKIYSINQFKLLNSFKYYNNKLLLYQFYLTSIKFSK